MINLDFKREIEKEDVFSGVGKYLHSIDIQYVTLDNSRPWGGFFVIAETQADEFITHFFNELPLSEVQTGNRLSPKILIVAPNKRLSWQYHHRRSEIWKVIGGKASISTSQTDVQGNVKEIEKGTIIKLKQGERHRLIGTETWGIVAEIWQHTDTSNPSNEEDIVRVQDDFGR